MVPSCHPRRASASAAPSEQRFWRAALVQHELEHGRAECGRELRAPLTPVWARVGEERRASLRAVHRAERCVPLRRGAPLRVDGQLARRPACAQHASPTVGGILLFVILRVDACHSIT